MMRSLWTAASGMIGQQSNLDVIANNLSNINSTGYKTQAANFKSLIYQTMQQKTTTYGRGEAHWCTGRTGNQDSIHFIGFYPGSTECFQRRV